MNNENDEPFFYDPNLLVVPASPNSTETLDDLDAIIDIAALPMHFDDGFVIENVDPAHDNTSTSNNSENESYTKRGQIRKRKKYNTSPKTRKEKKIELMKYKHTILPGCEHDKCRNKCTQKITENRRIEINKQYWEMNWSERKSYILNTCERFDVKSHKNNENCKRLNSLKLFLYDEFDVRMQVCKPFFLTTLGFKKTNDRVLNVLVSTPKGQITPTSDKRGKHPAINKFKYETLVMDHIESFNPTISHYRREHAPNIRYLPSDVTITFMHQHFIEKFPELDRNYISYEYYRCKVKEKNISFAQLGHEECELCESFNIHEHKTQILPECDVCTIYTTHINKTKKARDLYKKQADMGFD
ncbi:Uncharacterized protein FWK35_00037667, partial [Aphis craccivora]